MGWGGEKKNKDITLLLWQTKKTKKKKCFNFFFFINKKMYIFNFQNNPFRFL